MRALVASICLLVSSVALAAEPPLGFVACAPGYPGTTAEAQPMMDSFAAALAQLAGRPAGSVLASYAPTEKDGLQRLAEPGTVGALVPLPFFLKHEAALKLVARLQVETQTGATEVWSLVAKKGRVKGPESLQGFTVYSIAGYAPEFVRAAPGAWGRIPETVRVVESSQVLSSLRKVSSGADVAVLLDSAQAEALPTLPFADQLETVAKSEPLPGAVVASVQKRLSPNVEKALLGLGGDAKGKVALEGIRMRRFLPIDASALESARKRVANR